MNSHAVIETDTDGVIQRWNGGAEERFGHSAAVAIGLRVDFIVPEHLRDAHWAGFHRAMKEPKVEDLRGGPSSALRRPGGSTLRRPLARPQ